MVYTPEMRRAFHNVQAPKGFSVDLLENDNFLTLRIDEKVLFQLDHDTKIEAIQYVLRLKDALEQNGAVVLIVRKAMK
jgi:hypothetical protein